MKRLYLLFLLSVVAIAAAAQTPQYLPMNGVSTSPGGVLKAARVNGVYNVGACHGSAMPSWCGGVDALVHLQTVVNNAIAQMPLNAANCPQGKVMLDPTLGTYVADGQITKPRTVEFDGQWANIQYTPTSGVFMVIADSCHYTTGPQFTDQMARGPISNFFLYQGSSNTAGYSTNTAMAFFDGGDPAGVLSASTAKGAGQTWRNIGVTGFNGVLGKGNNSFGLRLDKVHAWRNYDVYQNSATSLTNSGESDTILDSFFVWQQHCDILNNNGQEINILTTSLDYINWAGGSGLAHMCGSFQGTMVGGHMEDNNGPFMVYTFGASAKSPRFFFVNVPLNLQGVEPAFWLASHSYGAGGTVTDPSSHTQSTASSCTSGSTTPTWNDSGGTASDGTCTWTDGGLNTYLNEPYLFKLGGASARYDITGILYNLNHPVVALADTSLMASGSQFSMGTQPIKLGIIAAPRPDLVVNNVADPFPSDRITANPNFDLGPLGTGFQWSNVPSNGIVLTPSATTNTNVFKLTDGTNVWFGLSGQGHVKAYGATFSTQGDAVTTTWAPMASFLNTAATNQKWFDWFQQTDRVCLRFLDDNYANATSPLCVTRSGTAVAAFIFGGGSNVVYRCATAGATLPAGSLTVNASACGTTVDTLLRVP